MAELIAPEKHISNYIKSFDGIRGVCCISVLLVHYHFTTFNLPVSLVYISLHCFFIMSAFLITKNLLRDKERSKNFAQCFKIFYIKRCARIFPVYFFYLGLTIFLFLFFKIVFHKNFNVYLELKRYGWMLFTFTYNMKMWIVLNRGYTDYLNCLQYPHLWSLSLEEQFYIIIIFLAWIGNKRFLQILSIFMIVVVPIVRIAGYTLLNGVTHDEHLKTLLLWQSTYFQFDAFFYGIALIVFDHKKTKVYLYLFGSVLLFIALWGFTNAYLSSMHTGQSIFVTLRNDEYFYSNYSYLFIDSVVNFFCVIWFLSVIYYPEKFTWIVNNTIVKFGELSYGLYVFQFLFLPVGLAVAFIMHTKLHLPSLVSDLIGAASYILMNFYFSRFIFIRLETPILLYRDKLLKKVYAQ